MSVGQCGIGDGSEDNSLWPYASNTDPALNGETDR
jgi:hypothetical protein